MPESNKANHQDVALLLKAVKFAADKHRNQRRKDSNASPYINHPIEVAERVCNVGNHQDISVICAAVLHDTVEDTDATIEEIESTFGKTIADLVQEVTDDKSLPKAERKQRQVEHSSQLSVGAKHIKLADKTCNVRDIQHSAPPDWSAERCAEYLNWSEQVVSTICGTNKALEADFYRILTDAKKARGV